MAVSAEHHVIIWEFRIADESMAEFLRYYGPDGEWAGLFRRAAGFLETLLLEDRENPSRYLTMDRWRSRADLEAFLEEFRADYDAMDRACEAFTRSEIRIGSFLENSSNDTLRPASPG